MSEAKALATGDLGNTPLGGLLFSIAKRRLSGSVVLAESEERLHCISLSNGFPHKVRLADAEDMLGELMVGLGVLAPDQIARILEHAAGAGILTGQAAIQLGLVQVHDVQKALVYQVLRRAARLFILSRGTYGYYQEDFLASFGGSDSPLVDPLAILAAGVRSCYDDARLISFVSGLENCVLAVRSDAETTARFRFNQGELAVVAALGTPQPMEALMRSSGQPPQVVYAVVHCLHMTESLTIDRETTGSNVLPRSEPAASARLPEDIPGEGSHLPQQPSLPRTPHGPGKPPPRSPAPSPRPVHTASPTATTKSKSQGEFPHQPSSEDGEKSERRIEAEALIAKGDEVDYFELLGVAADADAKEIQKAYVARARQFHPDRATGDMADLKPYMADLFARISVARQTLANPEKRADYLKNLRAKQAGKATQIQDEEAQVRKLLDADEAFYKAQVLTKLAKLDEAEELIKAAVEANPDQGDYLALKVWIESKKRGRSASMGDLIELLKKAVRLAPESENAHFYLAQLLYQSRQERSALKEHQEVVRVNEHNIDAGRMVRILAKKFQDPSEKKHGPSLGKTGGILKSFFGDKKK